ncbi:MAG: SPASM domain-containing protein [Chitinophagales bacterium]|nr:SPASM domain-containing protein [Chitinophagales bacterium]
MNKRRVQKAIRRIRSLPGGINFIKYTSNKIHASYLRTIKSPRVAHPSSIMFEVTNHCNLKCITCPREYQYGEEMDKGFMDIKQLKKVVDEVYPYVDSIGLTGLGETLLYKQLPEALEYIRSKNKGIITTISINAHLPNSVELVKLIADKLDTLQISMDGVGAIYEDVRLRGEWKLFYDNVKKIVGHCKDKRADVMFNFVAIKENYHTMADVVAVASELGVDYVNITPFNVAAVTAHTIEYYDFFHTDAFIDELTRAKEKADSLHNVTLTCWDIKSKNEFKKCHLPWNHFYISWDGYATPCCAKPFPKELNFGNVFDDGLMYCLNTPGYLEFRKMWLENKTPSFCEKCHMVDLKPIHLPYELPVN